MNIGVKRWKNAINGDVLSFGLNFHLKVIFFQRFVLQFSTIPFIYESKVMYEHNSMTSLLPHRVAQPTKWRFLPMNLSQLVIFVIELVFTWSWVNKNCQNLISKVFSMSKISFIILIFVSVKIIRLGEQRIINHFLITSFFEVVYFLKLGPIFVASYPSEHKSNHKNN